MAEKNVKFTRDEGLKKLKKLIKLGKIDEAEDLISTLRTRYPADKKIHNQYKSLTSKSLGNTQATSVSIDLNNLASLLNNRQFEALKTQLNSLLAQFPDHHELLLLKGIFKYSVGEYTESCEILKERIKHKVRRETSYSYLARSQYFLGKYDESLESFLSAYSIAKDDGQILSDFVLLLEKRLHLAKSSILDKMLLKVLKNRSIYRPSKVSAVLAQYIVCDPKFKNYMLLKDEVEFSASLIDMAKYFSLNELFLEFLKLCPIPNSNLEFFLTRFRREILHLSKEDILGHFIPIIEALILQLYLHDYHFSVSDAENKEIGLIRNRINQYLNDDRIPELSLVLKLGLYEDLRQTFSFTGAGCLNLPKEVFNANFNLPNIRDRLKDQFESLTKVTNETSLRVKDQYEWNPYPTWTAVRIPDPTPSVAAFNSSIKLRVSSSEVMQSNKPRILIAGCGTGAQVLNTAGLFPKANITALDLSTSSLAYAKQKLTEYGVENVHLYHCDILDVGKLAGDFDIIECVGVLHHMADPLEGLRALLTKLRPLGLLRLGLYSKIARQQITKLREHNMLSNISFTPEIARSVRQKIINSEDKMNDIFTRSTDFYHLSGFRDLLFHEQEITYSIPDIRQILADFNLTFSGFTSPSIVNVLLKSLPGSDIYDLNQWHEFEKIHPYIFASMYQFFCQKTV